jgi:hypothetical protein
MSETGRGNARETTWLQAGIGMGMTFMCSRCGKAKDVGGRRHLKNGTLACAPCLTPEEVADRKAKRGPRVAKAPPPPPVVLDWKAPQK